MIILNKRNKNEQERNVKIQQKLIDRRLLL